MPLTLAVNSAGGVRRSHPSVPAQSVKELVALIRSNAGKYSYASPGVGTPPQLVGARFRLSLDLDLVHVPFTGGGPAIGSIVAGHTPISFGAMAPAAARGEGRAAARACGHVQDENTRAAGDVPRLHGRGGLSRRRGSSYRGVVPARTRRSSSPRSTGKMPHIVLRSSSASAPGDEPIAARPINASFFRLHWRK